MKKALAMSVAVSLSVSIAPPVLAEDTFTICKGELDELCVPASIKIGCAESEDTSALKSCAVYGSKGKREREYKKVQMSSKGGNQCGYTTWKITCLDNCPK